MKAVIAMLAVVCLNITANGFLKQGALQVHQGASWFNLMSVIGALAFASAFLLYIFALQTLPLYLAQSLAVLQFVGAMLVSRLFFLEKISGLQWLGIAMIVAGILVVGFAAAPQSTGSKPA
jgi:undecaprenyl phosphate-alpha-L-ara4N flippase subunit ArnE